MHRYLNLLGLRSKVLATSSITISFDSTVIFRVNFNDLAEKYLKKISSGLYLDKLDLIKMQKLLVQTLEHYD